MRSTGVRRGPTSDGEPYGFKTLPLGESPGSELAQESAGFGVVVKRAVVNHRYKRESVFLQRREEDLLVEDVPW
jgi:hypothetical protein